ncbi:MAG: type II and III secretion system protein, partial [Phycisphaerales bacterium]|nr:type II and III secretion system protein [Phycisphaerales bacterium]
GGAGGGQGPYENYDEDEDALLERLIEIIQENIDPDSWIAGTPVGLIQEFSRNLVIRQTPQNHLDIGALLEQLREQRSVMINVETRFLQIDTDWFEEIGIDLDLYFNTNNSLFQQAKGIDNNATLSDFFYQTGQQGGQLKDPLIYGGLDSYDPTTGAFTYPANTLLTSPNGQPIIQGNGGGVDYVYQAGQPYGNPIRHTSGWSPIGVVQNSLGLAETIANGAFGSFAGTVLGAAPALGMGISFIDDIQVDLLVKATQADKRSIQLSAPRLTFFNGQGAWISINKQEAYVAGLSASTGDASGAFVPQVGVLPTGVVLHLKGAVSADRRYVTLNVYFQKSELDALIPSAPVTGAAGGGFGGGGAQGFFGSVQLPTISMQEIQVTTSVPDKGTALLGGQRRTSEYETEVGVPLLSKVPYINRFFTNRVTATSEDTLLILLRPEIIIHTENEERLFPGMKDRLRAGQSYVH